ncbi:MAG: putative metal-binding motif-containing protein [Deltaproteobacteria bacterium]|nr:putative metal-binding motif-containing protein [Deltaproteobacteria bacterium]
MVSTHTASRWSFVVPAALLFGACSKDTQASSDTTTSDASADVAPDSTSVDIQDDDTTDASAATDEGSTEELPGCGGVECEPFERCEASSCVPYAACSEEGTCESTDDVCRAGFCVPGDVDIDGDGAVARDDCDETNAEIHPSSDEACNGVDDDCNGETDEGDATALCETSGTGDLCAEGACVCAEGAVDIDPEALGCECVATPSLDQGTACAEPIDLGDYSDDGSKMVIEGTLVPAERDVWYRFRGVDSPDTSCDNYHVRVRFESDPDAAYAFTVCRGSCEGRACTEYLIDYDWRTDFRATIDGRLTGQCPCTAPGAPRAADVSVCSDDTADYFVRVWRRPGKPVLCSPWRIEISNGLYDTP